MDESSLQNENNHNHKKIKQANDYNHYNCIYTFKYEIEIVWKIFRDVFITNEMTKIFTTDTEMRCGKNSYTAGAEFSFYYLKLIKVYFRVLKVIDLPNYKKLVWKAFKSEPVNVCYYYIYEMYFDSIDDLTIIKWEIIYEKMYGFYFDNNDEKKIEKLKADMKDILNLINNNIEIIQSNNPSSVNYQSIFVKNDFEAIFKLILNLKKMIEIIPEIADKVEVEEGLLRENSTFKFFIHKKVFNFKINKITEDDREMTLEYELFTNIDKNKTDAPKQIIIWSVLLLDKNHSFLSFKHVFKEKLSKKNIEAFTQKKKIILIKFKNYFEQLNNSNSNNT